MTKKVLFKIKYFFWLLSGSNIDILKDSPTDHNRHANTGLAIFVTTLIAFCTGALAGYEFGSHTLKSALFFGLIWSILVFTIDRTMVLTLKKNPSLSTGRRIRGLIIPVFYRIFLSALISFFISIPLELWVFRENIELQLDKDRSDEISDKTLRAQENNRISDKSNSVDEYTVRSEELEQKMNLNEPPTNYQDYGNIKMNYKNQKNAYTVLQTEYNNDVSQRKSLYAQIPIYYGNSDTLRQKPLLDKRSAAYKRWKTLKNKTDLSEQQLIGLDEECTDLKKSLDVIRKAFKDEVTQNKMKNDSNKTKAEEELKIAENSVNMDVEDFSTMVNSQNGFTSKWVALNNIDDPWILFFIWFIRVVFFTIEMLPTMAKVTSPVGSYDWGVYRAERKKRKHLKDTEDLEILKMKELKRHKARIELETQVKIFEAIAKRQRRIASKILDKWEKKQVRKSREDLDE